MDEDLVSIILERADVKRFMSVAFKPHQDDLDRLIKLLNLTGAKSVLEFGSGWSTLVLALWANRHSAFVESLEADPVYYLSTCAGLATIRDIAPRTTGDASLAMYRTEEYVEKERYRVLFSPVSSHEDSLTSSYIYSCFSSPDFIYVDGPSLVGRRMLLGNIYELNKSNHMAFLVDGRWPQAWAIRKLFPEYTALMSAQISFICHSKFSDAIEWFKYTVTDCVVNPVQVVLENKDGR